MSKSIIQILSIIIISNIFLEAEISTDSKIRLLSSDVFFIETKTIISRNRRYPGSDKVAHVITKYHNDYYSLKFSIILDHYAEGDNFPLEIRVISPSNKVVTRQIEESLSYLELGEIYYYDLEIILNETGWNTLEIGKFVENENGEVTFMSYDKNQIYVRK